MIFLCWVVNQAVVCLTQNRRHLVALFLGGAFQGSTAADFSSSSSEEKGEIQPCRSLQLGWILTVGRPKFAAFKGPLDLVFWHCFLMDSSSYFTRLSEILYKSMQNVIGFGKHSVGDDRKRLPSCLVASEDSDLWRLEWTSWMWFCNTCRLSSLGRWH